MHCNTIGRKTTLTVAARNAILLRRLPLCFLKLFPCHLTVCTSCQCLRFFRTRSAFGWWQLVILDLPLLQTLRLMDWQRCIRKLATTDIAENELRSSGMFHWRTVANGCLLPGTVWPQRATITFSEPTPNSSPSRPVRATTVGSVLRWRLLRTSADAFVHADAIGCKAAFTVAARNQVRLGSLPLCLLQLLSGHLAGGSTRKVLRFLGSWSTFGLWKQVVLDFPLFEALWLMDWQ
jgi:hypothetical protein